jgi:hypothetical protein
MLAVSESSDKTTLIVIRSHKYLILMRLLIVSRISFMKAKRLESQIIKNIFGS